jgi:hypothetical protein
MATARWSKLRLGSLDSPLQAHPGVTSRPQPARAEVDMRISDPETHCKLLFAGQEDQ